jgi:hypothetical protein
MHTLRYHAFWYGEAAAKLRRAVVIQVMQRGIIQETLHRISRRTVLYRSNR